MEVSLVNPPLSHLQHIYLKLLVNLIVNYLEGAKTHMMIVVINSLIWIVQNFCMCKLV